LPVPTNSIKLSSFVVTYYFKKKKSNVHRGKIIPTTVYCNKKNRSCFWEGVSALEELQVSCKKAFFSFTHVAGASLGRSWGGRGSRWF